MSGALDVLVFVLATAASLAASELLISALEGVVGHLGLSEGALGLIAAIAADAPEITSAVTALSRHEAAIGAGVVVGSNVFNLAALLGIGGLVAGTIRLHRRVVELAGGVAIAVAAFCLLTLFGVVTPLAGLLLCLATFAPYAVMLTLSPRRIERWSIPQQLRVFLADATREEDLELQGILAAGRPLRHRLVDATVALVVVVAASIAMERAASALGTRFAIPGIIVGGVVLAAVTSLPNVVAAVHLARAGRAVAVVSTAFNSNAINVLVGFLLPAAIVGLPHRPPDGALIGEWYLALTAACVFVAWRKGALDRLLGLLLVVAYASFVITLVVFS